MLFIAIGLFILLAWASNPIFLFFGENQDVIQKVVIFLLGAVIAWLIFYNQMKAKKLLDPKLALNYFSQRTKVGNQIFADVFAHGDTDIDYSKFEIAIRGNHTAFRAIYGATMPSVVLDNSFVPDDDHTSLLLYVPPGEGKTLKEMLDAIALDQERENFAKIGEGVIKREIEKRTEED